MFFERMIVTRYLRIICVLALASVGFGHQFNPTLLLQQRIDAAAEFALPDGSIPSLCENDKSSGGKQPAGFAQSCEACRIIASVLLPPPSDQCGRRIAFSLQPALLGAHPTPLYPFVPPKSQPRAPPRSLQLV